MAIPWGAIAGAAGNILGGILGNSAKDDAVADQREFAQNSIQWRVKDARKAGIHPLFALGANTHSFSPVGIGGGLAEGVAAAGQDIGRALESVGTQGERTYNQRMMQLQLQRGELENQLLASQIARINTPTQRMPARPSTGMSISERFGITAADGDVMPIPERFGGTVSGANLVVNTPLERIIDPAAPYREPGSVAENSWVKTPTGIAPAPSYDANERMEDVFGPDLAWSWRNMILPNLVDDERVKPPAPAGYRWMWSIPRQEYQLVKQ